jgi:S1-C subfamily serine protease
VNVLDLVLAAALVAAGYGGYRFGLAARALSWAGLAVGTLVGVLFVDDIANLLQASTPRTRLLGSLAFLFLTAIVGQTLGIAAGSLLRRHLPVSGGLRTADRVAGALAGLLAVLMGVWLLTPALSSAPGWPARAARGSAIVRTVDGVAPAPPASLATLGRLVGDAPFPEVFEQLTTSDAGNPPTGGVPDLVSARVAASVVRIEGQACDQIQQGSGFVAASDVVVTNAHVVAGEGATRVFTPDGRRLDATVVAFNPDRDVAVLRVGGLDLATLRRDDGEVDETGSVFGYPRGGPLHESPARIAQRISARGTDIYRTDPTVRDVYVLAAELAPGDSGGPLVNQQGDVTGVAFAIDPGNSTTAFALTREEVDKTLTPVLRTGASNPVDAGPCLVG